MRMLPFSYCSQVTYACRPNCLRAPRSVDWCRPVDRRIPVHPKFRLAGRRKNVPNSRPHAFGRFPVLRKPCRESGITVRGYPVYPSAGTRCEELCCSRTSGSFSCPLPDQFFPECCCAREVPKHVSQCLYAGLTGWLFSAGVVCGPPSMFQVELPSRPISCYTW